MKGKERCKILKEIRQRIADENDIRFVTEECRHKGDCLGTCPKCESELRYLERELEKRRKLGKSVAIAGLTASIALSTTGCADPGESFLNPGRYFNNVQGAMTVSPYDQKELDGDIVEIAGDIPMTYVETQGELPSETYEPDASSKIPVITEEVETGIDINGDGLISYVFDENDVSALNTVNIVNDCLSANVISRTRDELNENWGLPNKYASHNKSIYRIPDKKLTVTVVFSDRDGEGTQRAEDLFVEEDGASENVYSDK
ncbi:MAG: hypothetical protein E7665_00235 [Ruminococcaceae bacterium]|nr:hypothetical protein [Oscillospiraceae bacterium]